MLPTRYGLRDTCFLTSEFRPPIRIRPGQLDTTTKRTIAENEQMSSELAWQSRETEKLIRRNDKLVCACDARHDGRVRVTTLELT